MRCHCRDCCAAFDSRFSESRFVVCHWKVIGSEFLMKRAKRFMRKNISLDGHPQVSVWWPIWPSFVNDQRSCFNRLSDVLCLMFYELYDATHVFLLSIKLCDLNQKLIFEKRNSVSWYVNGLIRFLKFFILKLNKKIQSFASFQLCKVPFPKTFFILPQLRFKIVSLREPTNDCEPLCVLSFVFRDISFYVEVFFKFYHAPTRAINIYFFISFLFIPISICAEGRFRKRSSKLNSAVIKSLFIRRQQEKRCFHAATVNNSKLILFCKWSIWL